jgi:hypothetical protein
LHDAEAWFLSKPPGQMDDSTVLTRSRFRSALTLTHTASPSCQTRPVSWPPPLTPTLRALGVPSIGDRCAREAVGRPRVGRDGVTGTGGRAWTGAHHRWRVALGALLSMHVSANIKWAVLGAVALRLGCEHCVRVDVRTARVPRCPRCDSNNCEPGKQAGRHYPGPTYVHDTRDVHRL